MTENQMLPTPHQKPAKRVIEIELPALERFIRDATPWRVQDLPLPGGTGGKAYEQQRTAPEADELLEQIGMNRGERVLVVAGHRATWALALAKAGLQVTYSDVSRELTDFVSKQVKHENIVDYICSSYFLYPIIPEQYDWTFTFEAVGRKSFLLLLSLLNRQGGKYVLWDMDEHSDKKRSTLTKTLEFCEDVYKVKTTTEAKEIDCKDRTNTRERRRHSIFTVHTSDSARKEMYLDLRLFHFFFKRRKCKSAQVCTLMHCSWEELRMSLGRLSKWSDLFPRKFTRSVLLECSDDHLGLP